MAGQPGFVFGRKRRKVICKNFHYIEVEKKTECVVEKDGEKCSVVKRPGTLVQSRYKKNATVPDLLKYRCFRGPGQPGS